MSDLETREPVTRNVAEWLRNQRLSVGLTQQAVAEAARDLGASLSRSHYSNLELGVYAPASQYIAVLDMVLQGNGALINLVEEEWGRSVAPLPYSDWVRLGESIHDSLEGDHPAPDLVSERDTRLWWANQPDGDAFVVEGRAQVEVLVHVLLSMAARDFVPSIKGPIEFTGVFEGFRDDDRRAGFPLSVRHALRAALERGYECRHHIPVHPDDTDSATLVYVAAPLMPCPKYAALIVDSQVAPTVENLLVIPGLAGVQFYATRNARHIDAALVHKGDHATRVIQQRIKRIAALSKEFVQRRDRTAREDARPTADEVEQKRFFAEATAIPGPSRQLLDAWPTVTIQPELYERLIERRQKHAGDSDHASWDEMIKCHRQRFKAFITNLEDGHPFQLILPESAMSIPSSGSPGEELTPAERREHFEFVVEKLLPKRRFEVAVAPDKWAKRIARCRWFVNERASGGGGVVSVQTVYTPPLDGHEVRQNRELRVDLKIEAPGAVRAFSSYFAHVWSESDQARIAERLGDAIESSG